MFFFKQKTAYELRISDWGSDVCSSDLIAGIAAVILRGALVRQVNLVEAGRHRSAVWRARFTRHLKSGQAAASAKTAVAGPTQHLAVVNHVMGQAVTS